MKIEYILLGLPLGFMLGVLFYRYIYPKTADKLKVRVRGPKGEITVYEIYRKILEEFVGDKVEVGPSGYFEIDIGQSEDDEL